MGAPLSRRKLARELGMSLLPVAEALQELEMDAMFNRSAVSTGNDRDFQYAVHSYHLEFHLRVAEFAGNPVLRSLIENNHVLIFNWLFDVAASRPPLPPSFHRDLAAALNSGKIETADRAMR
jgi:DNA-binding GntR family transcriptional regulator